MMTSAAAACAGQARLENVFVALHSMAAVFYGSTPMKRCAGAVMLGVSGQRAASSEQWAASSGAARGFIACAWPLPSEPCCCPVHCAV